MSAGAPLVVGILADHPAAGGARFADVVRLAFAEVGAGGRLAHAIELVEEQAEGLPRGSTAAVAAAFARLRERGAVAIIGPSISDNALVVRDLADAARLPCVNWTGNEQTRSAWMFQYQVGSLEEEPAFLCSHLAAERVRRAAVVADDSIVGRRYREFLARAAQRSGLELAAEATLSHGAANDLTPIVARLRAAAPEAVVYLGLWSCAHELADALAADGFRPRLLVANSALMYGHASPAWRRTWQGWRYVDAYSDGNAVLRQVKARLGDATGLPAVTVAAAYDMGSLVAEGLAAADAPERAALRAGLERVKYLPAALGEDGTTMGFGAWERGALKGRFLVLREWRGDASVEVALEKPRAT